MDVPADVVDPWKKKMIDKANNENLFTKWSHLWICGYQSHKTKKKIRLIRFPLNGAHMEEGGGGFTKWIDPPKNRRVEPVRGQGWGVHRQRQRMGSKPRS